MISKSVLKAFGINSSGKPLDGGQETSWKFGNIVLKPIEDEVYYSFTAEVFNRLQPKEYRISRPILSVNNKYVEDGYGATQFESGIDIDTAVKEKLLVSKYLHQDLKDLKLMTLPKSNDPWTKANNVLWRNHLLPDYWDEKRRSFCEELLSKLLPIDAEHQLIHGDLGGNVLFHDNLKPLVIDFSPTIAPVEYADAIILCDSIAWAGVDIETINYLEPIEYHKPFIQHAVAFRVLTIAFNEKYTYERLVEEWKAYKKIWDYICEI